MILKCDSRTCSLPARWRKQHADGDLCYCDAHKEDDLRWLNNFEHTVKFYFLDDLSSLEIVKDREEDSKCRLHLAKNFRAAWNRAK